MSRTRYKFKGYTITNWGYHQPDHCVWWEAVDENGEACFHGHSLREVEFIILDDEWEQKLRAKEREIENLKSSCSAMHKALKQASYFLNKHHMGGVYAPDGETLIYCWDVAKIVDEALVIQMPYGEDAQNA